MPLITVWPYLIMLDCVLNLTARYIQNIHPAQDAIYGPCRYLDSINGVSSHEQSTTCVTINGINQGNEKTTR